MTGMLPMFQYAHQYDTHPVVIAQHLSKLPGPRRKSALFLNLAGLVIGVTQPG